MGLQSIEQGKSVQNAFGERFYGRMRDELLNEIMSLDLAHARIVMTAWAADYNTERPRSAFASKHRLIIRGH
ncbi:transposase [Roseobacter sp. HKCCA0434]|uniref:integrase core domain-containing protein n=1 Tax=Roseobacter sp. HKCCA0434 TaxID=3079297 RepID=UPI002905DCBD|nr:transposase [Roseobacter sp. HKCCA0434]